MTNDANSADPKQALLVEGSWLESRQAFARDLFTNRNGEPWVVRDYQRESLESKAARKVHCDGRDVGKSTEIEIVACWAAIACPNSEMLIATQCENHLFPIMDRIRRRIDSIPQLSKSLIEARRSPWYLRFANGFVLWGRIAGPRGINFQGLHVDWQIVDEAQEMTESSWGELYQALNANGKRWVYGVPNGLRNTFYLMTQMRPELVEHHNWPSTLHPEWSAEKDTELALLYGGRNSPGYIHRVLGEHGEPMHAVFSLDDYLACVQDLSDFVDAVLHEGEEFCAPEVAPGDYYLGCDLGYARDPSEFVVYRHAPPHLINVLRLRLEGVNYARQQGIVEALDAACQFRGIGIDCGSNGRSLTHHLMALGHDWCEKVRAFEFGSSLTLAPLPDGTVPRRRTKEFMTELLQRRMAERSIIFPPLPDREIQYASHTYSVNEAGQIRYEKGNDHIIDADRCALLRHYLDIAEEAPDGNWEMGVDVLAF